MDIGSVEEQGAVRFGGVWNFAQAEVDDDSRWKVAVRKEHKSQKKRKVGARQRMAEQETEMNAI